VVNYTEGTEYTVTISCSSSSYLGFLIQAITGDTPGVNVIGTWGLGSNTDLQFKSCGGNNDGAVTHTQDRVDSPRDSDVLTWTAPSPGVGEVTFRLIGVKATTDWYGRQTVISLSVGGPGSPPTTTGAGSGSGSSTTGSGSGSGILTAFVCLIAAGIAAVLAF
jgi:hypothetical protein